MSEAPTPLELKLKVIVNCLVWVLGAELRFPERAEHGSSH